MSIEPTPPPEAVQLIVANRTKLEGYILCLVRDDILAGETLSDVTDAILNGFANYDASRSFLPWARGIAYHLAQRNIRAASRQLLPLTDDLVESLAAEMDAFGDESELELRREALHRCMERLPPRHLALLQSFYYENRSYPEISEQAGKSIATLYVIFNRLRNTLQNCIQEELRLQ